MPPAWCRASYTSSLIASTETGNTLRETITQRDSELGGWGHARRNKSQLPPAGTVEHEDGTVLRASPHVLANDSKTPHEPRSRVHGLDHRT
jgi:hypothetical protein